MSGVGAGSGWSSNRVVAEPVSVPRSALTRRILIVEDSPSARKLLQALLLRLGVTLPNLRMAANSSEALQLFTAWQPEIAFIDLQLRGGPSSPSGDTAAADGTKNGAELAVEFLKRNPALKVIICSASEPEPGVLDAFFKTGRAHAMVKPVLASKVADMLTRVSAPGTSSRSG
jgi:CheY-like chemotaxis protein